MSVAYRGMANLARECSGENFVTVLSEQTKMWPTRWGDAIWSRMWTTYIDVVCRQRLLWACGTSSLAGSVCMTRTA